MVVQSFSAHGVPMLGVLSLEGSTLELHCPGIAVQLPYEHNTQFDMLRSGLGAAAAAREVRQRAAVSPAAGAGAAAAAPAADDLPPPVHYALTVTVQNVQLSVAGEDAAGCLKVGRRERGARGCGSGTSASQF